MWKCLTLSFRQFKWLENYLLHCHYYFSSLLNIVVTEDSLKDLSSAAQHRTKPESTTTCWILGGPSICKHSVLSAVDSVTHLQLCGMFFSPLRFFPKTEERKQKQKRFLCRAAKQTFLFPPSNKGVGITHPNYISATCHEWYSRVAKINHIQKPVPGCSDPIPPAHLLLQGTEKAHTK